MVADAGRGWVLGSVPGTRCALESVAPRTLRTRRFGLASCGLDLLAAGGDLYLAAEHPVAGSDSTQLRIERFDPATGRSVVLRPVDLTLHGSAVAHTALAFGHGSLWLWGETGRGGVLVAVSPATGRVQRTMRGVPAIGGAQPLLVATAGGLWLAGGPGATAVVDRLAWGAAAPSPVYRGPMDGSVLWLAPAAGALWAAVVTDVPGGGPATVHVVVLGPSGPTAERPDPEGADPPTGTGPLLWALGPAGLSCTGPLRLLRIDAATGTAAVSATLPAPAGPCLVTTAVAAFGRTALALVGGAEGAPSVVTRAVG